MDGAPALAALLLVGGCLAGAMRFLARGPVALAMVLGFCAKSLGLSAEALRVACLASLVFVLTIIMPLTGLIEMFDERTKGHD